VFVNNQYLARTGWYVTTVLRLLGRPQTVYNICGTGCRGSIARSCLDSDKSLARMSEWSTTTAVLIQSVQWASVHPQALPVIGSYQDAIMIQVRLRRRPASLLQNNLKASVVHFVRIKIENFLDNLRARGQMISLISLSDFVFLE
jgi:hypothetical protein